jgi:hypothetical protein
MPRVGNKHFAYNSKGRAAAKAYAKKTGKPLMNKRVGRKK